jgi:hypothetical protein
VDEIESHESSVFSEPILSNRKTFFKERGREYDFYKNMVISDSKSTKELIDELLPKIVNVFDSSSLSLMRHELDHIDFFSSPFYIAHNAMSKKLKDLSHKLNDLKDTSVSEEFAQLNLKYLKQNSELVPILEGRALFFTYTPEGEFGGIGFSRVRDRVAKHIREGYIDKTYSHVIVDALISLAWSQGRMNRQTSNYLFQKITSLTGHPSSSRYVVDEEKVDYEQVFRIYHEELPKLMDVFRLNTDLAVDAIYHAYRYNPARLNEAKSATDFPGFMKIMSKIDYNLKIPL